MAYSTYYILAGSGSVTGAGTSGDPWTGDDVGQHALDNITRDSTNGDHIILQTGGGAFTPSAAWSLATYGTPTAAAPLNITNDLGATRAEIDLGGTNGLFASTAYDYIILFGLHVHNGGSANIIDLDNGIQAIYCKIGNTSGQGMTLDSGIVANCYFYNCGLWGVETVSTLVYSNYFENVGSNDFNAAIKLGPNCHAINNIIDIDAASTGINTGGDNVLIANNTVYSSSGTGIGIYISNTSNQAIVISNYVEGFSGVGGDGFWLRAGGDVTVSRSNRYYNNTSNYLNNAETVDEGDNSATSASGLTDPSNDDFSATSELKAGAWPGEWGDISQTNYLDIGAVQREEPTGGGGGRRSRIRAHGV